MTGIITIQLHISKIDNSIPTDVKEKIKINHTPILPKFGEGNMKHPVCKLALNNSMVEKGRLARTVNVDTISPVYTSGRITRRIKTNKLIPYLL